MIAPEIGQLVQTYETVLAIRQSRGFSIEFSHGIKCA